MFTNTPFGFKMEFPNGWAISVQWGPGNYCGNGSTGTINSINPFDGQYHQFQSGTAEIAVMYRDQKEWYPLSGESDDVMGWLNAEQVNEYIQWTAQLDSDYEAVMSQAQA